MVDGLYVALADELDCPLVTTDHWLAVADAPYEIHSQPGWDRFGLTATTDQQWIWLDSPDGDRTWPLRDQLTGQLLSSNEKG